MQELQENITIDASGISGTLHHVGEYVNFSSNAQEQEGNYLALDVEADPDATVTFELVGGTKGPFALSPDDRQVVCLIKSKEQSVKVTAEKAGQRKNTKTYALTGLTLEQG